MMKRSLSLFGLAIAITACGGKSSSDAGPGNQKTDNGPGLSNSKTYMSRCQPDNTRYLLQISGQTVVGLKQKFTKANCIGLKDRVDESVTNLKISKFSEEEALLSNGVSVHEVNSMTHYSDPGNFLLLTGTSKQNGQTKNISMFAMVTGRSPYSGNFPLVWTNENGTDIMGPDFYSSWVTSGNQEYSEYASVMSSCKKPETIRVPAGTFKTCRYDLQNGERLWVGNTPVYGYVKYEKEAGLKPSPYYLSRLSGNSTDAAVSLQLESVGL